MGSKKFWRVIEVKILKEAVEAVEFGLNQAGAVGTEITWQAPKIGASEGLEVAEISKANEKSRDEIVSVRAYFQTLNIKKADVLPYLQKAMEIYSFADTAIKGVRCFSIADKDWLRAWKKYWKSVETEKFIILPSWRKPKSVENLKSIINSKTAELKKMIFIEPGMAFGTGTHETTQLCLRAIEQSFKPGMSFFDVGTGTGILAIAASKISPNSRIVACDIDGEAINQAKRNAELNKTNKIEFYVGSITEETTSFDFISANLTIDTILPILPLLIQKSRKFLVLSGILEEQRRKIEEKLEEYGVERKTGKHKYLKAETGFETGKNLRSGESLRTAKMRVEVLDEWISVIVEFA
jgi:ribosomal protein L11 methyltransferase